MPFPRRLLCAKDGEVTANQDDDNLYICPICGSKELTDIPEKSEVSRQQPEKSYKRLCCCCGKEAKTTSPAPFCPDCGAKTDENVIIEEINSTPSLGYRTEMIQF